MSRKSWNQIFLAITEFCRRGVECFTDYQEVFDHGEEKPVPLTTVNMHKFLIFRSN